MSAFCAVSECARAGRTKHLCVNCGGGRAVFGTLDELRAHREKKHAGVFDPHFDDVAAVPDNRGDRPAARPQQRRPKRIYAALGECALASRRATPQPQPLSLFLM